MNKFYNKMIIQDHFNGDFVIKILCQNWDLNLWPFDQFLHTKELLILKICISLIDHSAAIGNLGGLAVAMKTANLVAGNISQSL